MKREIMLVHTGSDERFITDAIARLHGKSEQEAQALCAKLQATDPAAYENIARLAREMLGMKPEGVFSAHSGA